MTETIAIYLYQGTYGHGVASYDRISACARDYLSRCGNEAGSGETDHADEAGCAPEELSCAIAVAENGKPYFTDLPLFFSVSNSGELWACAVGRRELGLDVQRMEERPATIEKVSRRFYAPGEQECVREGGPEAFYEVWVRREAVAKLSGRGVFGAVPPVAQADGTLPDRIAGSEGEDRAICLRGIAIGAGYQGAVCYYAHPGEEEGPRVLIRRDTKA